ncbi:MAG: hypothetical protein LPK85_05690, partial [Gammaproteobacteria bacterium]|nr:hypothetical protein [Gammaproteobacteria bacterium]
ERPVTPPAPAPRPAAPAPEAGTEGAGNTALSGLLADGGFLIKLGDGIRLSATDLGNGAILRADLRAREDLRVPGVRLTEFSYNTRQGSGELKAQLTIPQVEQSELRLIVERDGRTRLRGTVNINTQLGVLNNPRLRLGIGEDDHFTAQIEISGAQLVPRGVRKLTITGGGTLRLTSGKFSGDMGFDLAYDGLGSGRVNLRFSELGEATGDGRVNITHPVLNGAEATLAIQGGDVTADVLVPAARLQPPVPGLTLGDGNVHITFRNHQLSGGLEGVNLSYRDLGSALLNARFERDHLEGSADLTLNIPGLSTANGTLGYNRDGRFYGSFAIGANSFPEGLPIESGELRGAVGANGQISFSGSIGVVLGPAGRGQLNARYEGGVADISATVTLNNLPGLNAATVNVRLINGDLEGSADLSIDSERLPGFSTTLHVEYKEQRWSAEQALAFSVDDGKLSGDFTLGIRQNEDNSLSVYGSGDLTARIAPNLEGSLGATLNEDGTIDTRGEIRVPEPIELFPEKRADRELFRHSQNIPLWAILVAVIRIRAGLRAGVGPGVLRDITVSGEYTIGGDEDPSLSVSGELYSPAFAEAYVAIGAGLGLDVALGSLTGGIEAMATAGIYGAISVIPELAYENGDYLINGTATLAAGAKFKLGLNAWAEIEALWVTVWEKEWQLAEWVWNLGPTLALQARLSYNFSRPEPPELTFDTENVPNMDQMVQDAMPRDRPAGSGAREAMRNRAEWAGPTRQAQQAAPLPDALTQQSQAAPQPAQAPQAGSGGGAPQPGQQPVPGRAPGAAGTAPAPGSTGASPATPGAAGAPPSPVATQAQTQGAQSQAPAEQALPSAEAPVSDTPRHPDNPGLSALDLPPVAVPRTADQQQADLTAAGRVLNAATAA